MNKKEPNFVFSPQITTFESFAGSVDPSRTNMSAKQLTQVVVSSNVEVPFIFNKNFEDFTKIDSKFVEYAPDDGIILFNKNNIMIFYNLNEKKLKWYYISPYLTWDAFAIKLKYINQKKSIKKGDILFDYSHQTTDASDSKDSTKTRKIDSLPRIGYRANVLYSAMFGYNADDALIISESFSKKTTIDYSKKILIPITKEINYLKNENGKYFYHLNDITPSEYSKYIKIDTTRQVLSEFNNMADKESKFFSKIIDSIEGGKVADVKIHQINQKSPDEIKKNYLFNEGLIEEVEEMYARTKESYFEVLEYMQSLPGVKPEVAKNNTDSFFYKHITNHDLNKPIITELVDRFNIDAELIDYVIEVDIGFQLGSDKGDKFANSFAGKGVVSVVIPDDIMPCTVDGTKADIIFNPLGVFGRNNWGTVYEETISYVINDIEKNVDIFYKFANDQNHLDKDTYRNELNGFKKNIIKRLQFVNKNLIKTIDIEYYNNIKELILLMLDEKSETFNDFIIDVKDNGFFLYINNFPDITYNQFMEDFILLYEETFKINCSKKQPILFKSGLSKWLRDKNFSSNIFSGIHKDRWVDLKMSSNYFIKLQHTSESKFNSVSFASSYNASTGQPIKGKKRNGGGHMSWMSNFAFCGQVVNSKIKQELYTIKSDATFKEKTRFSSILMSGKKYYLKDHYESLTKNAINVSLKLMALVFKNNNEKEPIPEKIEDYELNDLFDDEPSLGLIEDNEFKKLDTIIGSMEDNKVEKVDLNYDYLMNDPQEFEYEPIRISTFDPDRFKFIEDNQIKLQDFYTNSEHNYDNDYKVDINKIDEILDKIKEDNLEDEIDEAEAMKEVEDILNINSAVSTKKDVPISKEEEIYSHFGNEIDNELEAYKIGD